MIDLNPLWLTAELALITTVILLVVSVPLCYWLAFTKFKFKSVVEAIVSLPLVLPPSVLVSIYWLLSVRKMPSGNFWISILM